MNPFFKRALFLGSALAFISPSAMAAWDFPNGNLLLGVQATGGTGSTKNVFFNLGPGTSFRDNGNQGLLGNINTELTEVFGADWFTRTDLYFGVIGNLSSLPTSGLGSAGAVNGDPSRTFYTSRATTTPGNSVPWTGFNSSLLGTAGNDLNGQETMVRTLSLTTSGSGAAILDQSTQPTEWNNGWTKWNPTSGAAYTIFDGGIQNSFGQGGSAVYVDVQRILATTTGADPTGTPFVGSYETTIAIGSDGSITSLTGSSATPYDTWIAGYPSITAAADKLSTADPDKDGATNLEEFAFGGNPSIGTSRGTRLAQAVDTNSDPDTTGELTLTIEVRAGATFTASGNDLAASVDNIDYVVGGSTDLSTFNSAVSEVTPHLGSGSPATGYEFKTFRLAASNGLAGKGFLRATATE